MYIVYSILVILFYIECLYIKNKLNKVRDNNKKLRGDK